MLQQLNSYNNGQAIQTFGRTGPGGILGGDGAATSRSMMNAGNQALQNHPAVNEEADGWNDLAAKTAIRVASEKLNSQIKQCRQSLEDVRVSIQTSTNDRYQDTTFQENAVKNVAKMELEMTQVLAMLPFSRPMYDYKVSQINGIAKERRDLEKILLEQKLGNKGGAKAKNDQEYLERQRRIKEDLRKAMGETEEVSGDYNPKLGFDIHFDYILELPEMHQSCQVVFGVYKQGQAIIRVLKTDTHAIEVMQDETKRSLFGEKKTITGVPMQEEVMMFFELMFTNRLDRFQQGISFGWTTLDLFSTDKTLKTGRFKLPFYAPPMDSALTKERISYMTPLPDTYMYVRINHPAFADEKTEFNMFSDLASVGYTVPLMHDLKESDQLGKTDDVDALSKLKKMEEDQKDLEEVIENQKAKIEELMSFDFEKYGKVLLQQQTVYTRLNKDPFAPPDIQLVPANQAAQNQGGAAPQQGNDADDDEGEDIESMLGLAAQEKPTKGLKVSLIKLEKILGKKDISISMKIFYQGTEMRDERGEMIDLSTAPIPTKAKTDKKAEDVGLKDVFKIPYNFSGLFAILKRMKKSKTNCYILWKIMRVDSSLI